MQSAARKSIPFVVLDRPHPIGGEIVEGALLDPAFKSFVGMYPIPARHGMTVGELAPLSVVRPHWSSMAEPSRRTPYCGPSAARTKVLDQFLIPRLGRERSERRKLEQPHELDGVLLKRALECRQCGCLVAERIVDQCDSEGGDVLSLSERQQFLQEVL
jgi:Protein of unknown function (DUF1343)